MSADAITECPSWCDWEHPEKDSPHSGLLALGHNTRSHGELYRVELDGDPADGLKLWVSVESTTLTADQAEVFARALLVGAGHLRAAPGARREVDLSRYWNGRTFVDAGAFEFPPTPAEQEVHDQAREVAALLLTAASQV